MMVLRWGRRHLSAANSAVFTLWTMHSQPQHNAGAFFFNSIRSQRDGWRLKITSRPFLALHGRLTALPALNRPQRNARASLGLLLAHGRCPLLRSTRAMVSTL